MDDGGNGVGARRKFLGARLALVARVEQTIGGAPGMSALSRLMSGWSRRRGLVGGAAGLAVVGLILGLVLSLGGGPSRTSVAPGLLPGTSTTVPVDTVPDSIAATSTTDSSSLPGTTVVPVGSKQTAGGSSTTLAGPLSHWIDRSPPSSMASHLAAITCLDAQHCWALGTHATSQSGCCDLVLSTHDGGASWSDSNLPAQFTAESGSGQQGLQVPHGGTAISCPVITECWVVGFDAGQPAVATSTDGGLSWSIQATFTPGVGGPAVSTISCGDSGHCVALFPLQPSPVVYLAGGVWKPAVTLPPGNYSLWTLSCSAAVCTAAGKDSPTTTTDTDAEIIESQDGGSTWSPDGTSGIWTGALANLSCVQSGRCWLPWDVQVSHSAPGALVLSNSPSWGNSGSLPDGYHASQISCTGTSNCMVAASIYSSVASGHLVFTTADGTTWTSRPAPSAALLGVSCISSTTCWVIPGDGHVYLTTDGAGG